jgi:hypothetical protein
MATSSSTNHRKESPTPVMDRDLSLPCIQKSLRKKTKKWLKDGKGTLRESSSSCVLMFASDHRCTLRGEYIDRFILCRRCYTVDSVDARPQAELTRYICVLSSKDVSASSRPQRVKPIKPFYCGRPSSILSPYICSLGELALVPELGHQPYVRHAGDVLAPVGTPIPQGYAAHTVQSTQTGADARILFEWRRQVSGRLGG